MNLRKTLLSHRAVPAWVQPVAVIGLGLYFGWEAIRPDGNRMIRAGDVEDVLAASADLIVDAEDYMDHTERLHRAYKEGDREVLQRVIAEQEALNRRMEERLTAKRATEEKGRAERAVAVRRARVTFGIVGALLLLLGVWTLVAGRSKNSEQAG
jgi:cytochrome c-type biogenesis protein CcmH/NrfG